MMIKYTSKINKIRTFALSLVFIGIIIMYAGLYFRSHFILMSLFMLIGFLATLASAGVYFWIGMISTNAVQVVCPNCDKITKVLGRADACMSCNQPLTLDKNLEGLEFDEKYNSRRAMKQASKK
ncbi:YgzB family protein [Fictibacillus enclensis]|nr:YgzB family protein [Fictibacillus enclensis]MDM5197579.1 YgzB family protein [Fictibacillus enclensis]